MAGRSTSRGRPVTRLQTPDVKNPDVQRAFDVVSRAIRDLQGYRIPDLFTATEPGYVPAAGTDATAVLHADGTWSPVSGGGGGAVDSVTAGSLKVTCSPTTGAVVVDVVPANFTGIPESGVSGLVSDLAGKASLVHTHVESDITGLTTDLSTLTTAVATKVSSSRLINTTAPIAGGGDLSADLTISLNDDGVTDAKLRNSAALSVIGRSANSIGDPADIVAASDGDVLRRSGTTLGFGGIPESSVIGLVADLAAKVPTSRTLSAGTGLSGGGTLAADRTFALANTAVTPGSYVHTSVTVDAQGRITAASSGTGGGVGVEWFGGGNMGAITFDGTNPATSAGFPSISISPSSGVYTLVQDLYATDITVGASAIVVTNGWRIFATGTSTIDGVVQWNGNNAITTSGGIAQTTGSILGGGAAGGAKGVGGGGLSSTALGGYHTPTTVANGGAGDAGGAGTDGGVGPYVGTGGGGGGANGSGLAGGSTTLTTVANAQGPTLLAQIRGQTDANVKYLIASGGGGGGTTAGSNAGGGGGGAGHIVLCARVITGSGAIQAKGGDGANFTAANSGGGGGGGGGMITLVYSTRAGSVTISVAGGAGGLGSHTAGGTNRGFDGGRGHDGYVYAFNLSGDGT